MHRASAPHRSIASAGIVAVLLLVIDLISPAHAAAQATTIRTSQLLPPGETSCQQLSIVALQPHIYDGMLESFDVTVSDTDRAYVGVFATVNGSELPLNMITRWAGDTGSLRLHVDTPDTPISGSVPVTLTLLGSLPSHATCIARISFDIDISNNVISTPSAPSTVSAAKPSHAVTVKPNAEHHSTAQKAHTDIVAASSSSALVGAGIAAESISRGIGSLCASPTNAYELWFVLLALYIVLVAVVILMEPWFLRESAITSTAAILVPLIVLLAFWYFSENCRAASWIPVGSCIIAIIGLFLAFREYETTPLLTGVK